MQRIAINVMGLLPATDRDKKYILVISDYYTKWVESYAMPNQEAVTVANVAREFISGFGVPRQLYTDQGWNFEPRSGDEQDSWNRQDKDHAHALKTELWQHGWAIQQDPRGHVL